MEPGLDSTQDPHPGAGFFCSGAWPTNVMSNHDLPRAASRYARGENDAQAMIAMALLLTLRGTPFMYYGEEIGMRDIHLRRSKILDPAGKRYWPIYTGRDGCRSPMQWDDRQYAGFSTVQPWLPINPDAIHRNVAAQQADPNSLFSFTKKLLRLRRNNSALQRGNFVPLKTQRGILAYIRILDDQCVLIAINFKGQATSFALPQGIWHTLFTNKTNPVEGGAPLAPYEVRLLMSEK